jgi:hypothetical protein
MEQYVVELMPAPVREFGNARIAKHGESHAAFLNESRTRGGVQSSEQILGPKEAIRVLLA